MELGEKLRNLRLELGMTQKQLCDGIVTRNMLSQIENGLARPSMKTLEALAARMNQNISFFLEETAVLSANTEIMADARRCMDSGDYAKAMNSLEGYKAPDPVYDREKTMMEQLCLLELARVAMKTGKRPYAQALLERLPAESPYCHRSIQRERQLLLAEITGELDEDALPSIDEELCLRSSAAFRRKDPERAAALLDACRNRAGDRWNYLRGRCYLAQKDYLSAKTCLLAAEKAFAEETVPLLETCFRELGDYRQAYAYACKQKK